MNIRSKCQLRRVVFGKLQTFRRMVANVRMILGNWWSHSLDIKLNIRKEISYLRAPMFYSLLSDCKLFIFRHEARRTVFFFKSSIRCFVYRPRQCGAGRTRTTESQRCFGQRSSDVHVPVTKSRKSQTRGDSSKRGDWRPANQCGKPAPGLSHADGSPRQESGYTFAGFQSYEASRYEDKNKEKGFSCQETTLRIEISFSFWENSSSL